MDERLRERAHTPSKDTKIVAVASGDGLPLAVSVQSATHDRMPPCEEILAESFLDEFPARLIGDKAYDSDRLNEQLATEYGIKRITPNQQQRGKTQDWRLLCRYKRRRKIERLFAWLHNFHCLVTRWERHVENFLGFV